MTDGEDAEVTTSEVVHDDQAEPLGRLVRAGALVAGLVLSSAGGVAAFVSSNQAGTAVLLVVGAAFLLMGLQGTPLKKLASGNNSLELAMVRRRWKAAVIAGVERDESPEVAAAVVEAFGNIDAMPDHFTAGYTSYMMYENRASLAIARVTAGAEPGSRLPSWGKISGLRLNLPSGLIDVRIKYRRTGALGLEDVQKVADQLSLYSPEKGWLMMTNAPLSDEVRQHNADASRSSLVEVVTWNDERDDGLLARAIGRNVRLPE